MNNFIILIVIIIIFLNIIEIYKKKKSDNSKSKKIMSNTEKRIAEYLERLNVRYKLQYTFKSCRDIKPLPFDFAIIDNRGKVLMLIEYDGEQHSHPVKFKNEDRKRSKENYKLCKKHDNIKNNFCKRKKINLLRIDYTQNKDLYKILRYELKKNNIIE